MARTLLIAPDMRIAAFALLGACTFTPGEPMTPGGGSGSSDPGGTPPGVDAAPVANRPPCDLSDPTVQLCLDFEEMPLGLDSSLGQHDATVSNASMTRRSPENAIAVDLSSNVHIDETMALDISDAITYEAWIAPTSAPPPYTEAVVLANFGQYAVSVQPDGKVRCELAGIRADSKDPISFGTTTWTHVACTYDRNKLVVYINGDVSHCTSGTAPIATNAKSGTSIGPFVGSIDNVHVLSRAASDNEVCAHAGRSECNNSCE